MSDQIFRDTNGKELITIKDFAQALHNNKLTIESNREAMRLRETKTDEFNRPLSKLNFVIVDCCDEVES